MEVTAGAALPFKCAERIGQSTHAVIARCGEISGTALVISNDRGWNGPVDRAVLRVLPG